MVREPRHPKRATFISAHKNKPSCVYSSFWRKEPELFNFADNPQETTTLAEKNPEEFAELSAKLDQMLKDTDALLPSDNPKPRKEPLAKWQQPECKSSHGFTVRHQRSRCARREPELAWETAETAGYTTHRLTKGTILAGNPANRSLKSSSEVGKPSPPVC